MENWILLISFVALLTGVFVFKKLWLGVLLALAIVLSFHVVSSPDFGSVSGQLTSGIIISFELSLLLFGAYLFYTTLSSNNHFSAFAGKISGISSKLSIVLILCLFMGSFMEGIAGFGIPAMLIAPLMLAIGFNPLTSAVLPLSAMTPVLFGALGTPIKIGLNMTGVNDTVIYTLVLNILPVLAMPFVLAILYSKTEKVPVNWAKDWKILSGAGICFLLPFFLTGFVSVEYPSVAAGVLGLILFVRLFVPKNENLPFALVVNTFAPYFLFIALLLMLKYVSAGHYWKINESAKAVSYYQPGAVFVVTCIGYLFITQRTTWAGQLFNQTKTTGFKIGKSIATICLLVCFSQLIQDGMSDFSGSLSSAFSREAQLATTPAMGVIGSFITGSATLSNLLFTHGLSSSSWTGNFLSLLFALLLTGSAVGNAISFQNIVMVKSVIADTLTEARVIRYTILAVGYYLLFAIATAFIIFLTAI